MKRIIAALVVLSLSFACPELYAQDTTKPAPPPPPTTITYEDGSLRLGKDIFIRAGALMQPSFEFQQDLPTATQDTLKSYNRRWAHQLFIRRMRLLFGGKVSQAFTFFFDFEVSSEGRFTAGTASAPDGSKNMSPTVNLLDAQLSYIASQEFSLLAGVMLLGITRNGLESATALMPVNYGAYTFSANAGSPNGLDNFVGRDVGVMLRGVLLENRLEYRVSIADGRARLDQTGNPQSLYSPYRLTTRVQYDLFDKQIADLYAGISSFYYTGSYFGKKKVLAVGGGLDMQRDYVSYAGDVFFDYPIEDGDGLTVSLGYQHLDGGSPDPSDLTLLHRPNLPDSVTAISASSLARLIPKQGIFFAEAGYYINSLKLQPIVKFESKTVSATELQQNLLPLPANATASQIDARSSQLTQLNDRASESRFGVGLNYLPRGNNFNVKAMFEMVSRTQAGTASSADPYPEFKKSYSIFTLQGQWFFF